MSVAKKSVWGRSGGVNKMMENYLGDAAEASWTMKRLLTAMVEEHGIGHRKVWMHVNPCVYVA